MGLALLMASGPAEESSAASELRRIIALDQEKVSRYRSAFDPYPATGMAAFSTESYDNAQGQVNALKGLLKDLAAKYRRHQFRSYRVLFRNEALADSWRELQQSVSQVLDLVDKTRPNNYSRVNIWSGLDWVCIAYENVTDRLKPLDDSESRLQG